jgi:large subunit ribosomal protein L5
MADKDNQAEGQKADKAERAPKPERAPKGEQGGQQAQQGQQAKKSDKGDKGGDKGKAPAENKPREPEEKVTPRLRTQFDQEVRQKLTSQFGYTNGMQVPKIDKVVVNMGIGEGVNDRKKVETAANDLALIAGQKPVITKARKSIATYKLRDGQAIGCKVTLRKARMYEFLDRLVNIALPRVRDFRGVSPRGFDGRGNFTLGLKDQLLFPEIDYMKVDKARGMNISVVTTAKTDEESRKLLQLLGMPFRNA